MVTTPAPETAAHPGIGATPATTERAVTYPTTCAPRPRIGVTLPHLGTGMSPGQIERYAQERSITIISNLLPTKPLAEAFRDAYGAVFREKMPPEYGIQASGRGKLLQESIQSFLIAFVLLLLRGILLNVAAHLSTVVLNWTAQLHD